VEKLDEFVKSLAAESLRNSVRLTPASLPAPADCPTDELVSPLQEKGM
jgi:hypothetical protein